jgi:shikimate kinase
MSPSGSVTDARALVLVGLPGSGKTTVGRAVAAKLGWTFADTDALIVARAGKSIAEIFAAEGEPAFRALEREVTLGLVGATGTVIATGGGWAANGDCLSLLAGSAQVVYLQLRAEAALARMGAGAKDRPLLSHPEPLGELRRLLAARESFYLKANHTLSVESVPFDAQVLRIVALATGGHGH